MTAATLFAVKLLALETGSLVAAITAVELDDETAAVPATRLISEPRALARDLIGAIDGVLREAGWELRELDGIGAGTGPGSWTSLRVGLSTAKTLAQAWDIPLAGVPSFDGVAMSVLRRRTSGKRPAALKKLQPAVLVTLAPCRPGEFYAKIYETHADFLAPAQSEFIAPLKTILDAAHTQKWAGHMETPLLIAGEAARDAMAHLNELNERFELIEVTSEDVSMEIAIAAANRIAAGETDDFLSLVPLYLAPSNAERNLLSKA